MEIATIGFTRTSAESFFRRIAASGVSAVWDVRLNKSSQLAGFAKHGDLEYFLKSLCGIGYVEVPELAPEADMLKAYRAKTICWDEYQDVYLRLIRSRRVEQILRAPVDGRGIALLCTEYTPQQCHRRLAAEYLQQHWKGVVVRHL